MANNRAAAQPILNPEKLYESEEPTAEEEQERERAAALSKIRALDRMKREQMGVQEREAAPENVPVPAELFAQEFGRPVEAAPSAEAPEEEAPGEEAPEEEGEETGGGGAGAKIAEEQKAAATEKQATITQQQMAALRRQNININRQIKGINAETEKKLVAPRKALQIARTLDRTKNAVRWIRAIGGLGVSLWWTIIVPLLALLLILAIALLVWGAGINLGSYSANTLRLQKNYDEKKKKAYRERDRQTDPLKKQLQQINRELNSLYTMITQTQ